MSVEEVSASHRRLMDTVDRIDDAGAASPLPGWTLGHVLTHVARNADSFTWLLDGALAGEKREQYPGGLTTRNAAIDAGAGRPLEEIVADVRRTCARLEAAMDRMDDAAWSRPVGVTVGDVPASQLVISRRREVEVHHVDLGRGYTPADWPSDFVASELDRMAERLESRLPAGTALRVAASDGAAWEAGHGPASVAVSGPGAWLLAWLMGRDVPPGRLTAPGGLPPLKSW